MCFYKMRSYWHLKKIAYANLHCLERCQINDFSIWNFSYFYLIWYSSDTVIVFSSIPEHTTLFHASCFCIQKSSSLEYLLSFLAWLPNNLKVSLLLLSLALLPWLNILALLIASFPGHYLITEYSYVKVITE